MRNFWLVRRIGRVPGRIFQNVALDDRWRDGAVIALTDQRGQNLVLVGGFAQTVQSFTLGECCTPGERGFLTDGGRNSGIDQSIKAAISDDFQHFLHFCRRRADMTTVCEVIGLVVREMEISGRCHYAISSL